MEYKKNKKVIIITGYILLIAVLKLNPFSQRAVANINIFSQYNRRDMFNLIPLKTIGDYVFNSNNYNLSIILNFFLVNLLLFVPVGSLLGLSDLNRIKKVSILIFTPILFEILQTIFKVGVFDIDTIILNIFGSLIAFKLTQSRVKPRTN